MKKDIFDLLEENNGYNPEAAFGPYEFSGGTITKDGTEYNLTDAKDMRDYITRFPKRYGLIVNGRFYAKGEK